LKAQSASRRSSPLWIESLPSSGCQPGKSIMRFTPMCHSLFGTETAAEDLAELQIRLQP